MKTIYIYIIILTLFGTNLIASNNQNLNKSIISKNNSSKKIEKLTDKANNYKDALTTIDAREKEGWELVGLLKDSKTGAYTLYFERVVPDKSIKKINQIPIVSDKVPDGTYVGQYPTRNGTVPIEDTYKDNKLVKRVINGKTVDVSNWEQ